MPFMTGDPLIEETDYDRGRLADYTPSLEGHAGASFGSTSVINPVSQFSDVVELSHLSPGEKSYIDEFGNTVVVGQGIDVNDPRARYMSLDEANEKGAEMGLRFSQPPTQGQFDFMAKMKQSENARAEIMSHAPLVSVRTAIGFTAGLAASMIDPLNIASAFVPIVGPARYANLVARFGRQGARLAKGALEGGVGAAMITPLTYAQAQVLQQDYDVYSAFSDIVMGGALGAGLHWGGGAIKDASRRVHYAQLYNFLRENDANMPHPSTFDRRGIRVQEGDNATRHESLSTLDRARVLETAVKAVENDQVPKIDALFASDPKLADISIPDKRFPATVKLRSPMSAADHAVSTQGASIIDMATSRRLTASKLPQSPKGVFDLFAKRYKKLNDYALKVVTPAEFGQRAGAVVEHPEQRVAIEPGSKTILVTEGASLGAVRHEVERALDEAYNVPLADRGGYRYDHRDLDQLNAHRAAYGQHLDEFPNRSPTTAAQSPRETLDLMSRQNEPILGAEGPKASELADETVNRDKDKQLDTIIADEEIAVVESIVGGVQGRAKDLGIMDKVIPAEEREILAEAFARQGKSDMARDLFSIADEIIDEEFAGKSTSDAELLMRAGPEKLAEIIKAEKSTEDVIKEVADTGLVTRVNAGKDVKFYLHRIKQELSGDALERAIRDVQAGEDINVAVDRLLPRDDEPAGTAGEPAKAAEQPAEAKPASDVQKDESLDDFWGDIIEDAKAIIDAEKIYDKRDLVKGEAAIVKEEHAALETNPKTRDLFSAVERDEFDAADRDRALREGDGTAAGGGAEGAGDRSTRAAVATELQTATFGRDGKAVGGAEPAAIREGETPGGERSAPATAQSYGGWNVPRRVITPDNSIEVTVEPRIVELADLVHAEGAIQVRDRTRKESQVEAFDRALKLDPEQLLPNRVADAGSPIVVARPGGGYTIVSGNGRVLSLRQVYGDETFGGKARQYRERIGAAADGYRRPILVSVITDQLSDDELAKFAERANRSRIAEMSATEKAQRDADFAGIDIMSLYHGGDFTKSENQAFTRAFMMKVATAQERGDMSKDGVLTKGGVDRLNAAVLAAAYDDTGVLSLMLESTDNNIKSISSAYRDVAPIFMRLRAEIAKGLVREEMDITAYMMEAARFIQKAREENIKINSALSQVDALNPMDPVVDTLIRQFYNPQLTRANSALRIAESLRLYAEAALEKRTGGFLEDTTSVRDVMAAAERRFAREADEEVLAIDDEDVGGGAEANRAPAPQPAPAEPRTIADLGSEGRGAQKAARPAAKIDPRAQAVIDRAGGEQNVADIMGVPDRAESKIRAFLDDVAKMGALDKAVPADPLRADLEKLKVPEIRAKAKAEGLVIKGRSKEEVIASYLKVKAADKTAPLRQKLAELREPTPVEQANATRQLDLLVEAVYQRRDFFDPAEFKQQLSKDVKTVHTEVDQIRHDNAANDKNDEKYPSWYSDARVIAEEVSTHKPDNIDFKFNAILDLAYAIKERNGRVSESDIKSILDYAGRQVAASPVPEQPKAVKSTLSDFAEEGGRVGSIERLTLLQEDIRSLNKRTAFAGKAKTIVDRLERKAIELDDTLRNRNYDSFDDIKEAVTDMADDAARLAEIDPRPEAKVVSQWVRALHREVVGTQSAVKAIEAAPEPVAAPKIVDTPEGAVRTAFYDFLEGGKPIKGSGALAKELGIDPNAAYLLLDEAERLGWIKLKDNGTYIRVPRDRRPPRPDVDVMPADTPRGWGGEDMDEQSAYIREVEFGAIRHIADIQNTSPQRILSGYGFRDRADYVAVARGLGFEVPKEYDRIRSEIDNVKIQRDLQAQLTVQRAISKALHRMPEAVKVQVEESLDVAGFGGARGGMFSRRLPDGSVQALIRLARSSITDAVDTINHEIFHALRVLGLFTSFEWRVVRDASAEAGGISKERLERYEPHLRRAAENRDLAPDVVRAVVDDKLAEEWAATEFGKWSSMRDKNRETPMGRLWTRVEDFVKDLRQSFTNLGRLARGMEQKPTLEQIYRAIEDGSIARRYEEWGLGRSGTDNPLSVNRQAGNEFAAMLNDDMRTLAHDDSESIGRATETALQHMAPCASYHL